MGTELAESLTGAMAATIPPAAAMGVTVLEARRGYAKTRVPMEGNGNHFGVMYAGVQFTVAEILGGVIAMASFDPVVYFPLVKKIDIEFVAMARTDLSSEASLDDREIDRIAAEAAEHGKADFVVDAEVKDEAGQTVARTHGLYQLRAQRK